MQPCLNRFYSFLDRMFQSAFPDNGDAPTKSLERLSMAFVTVNVPLEFLTPELFVGSRNGCVATVFVPMPETAVNEYHCLVLREHKVRGAGQLPDVKSISEPSGKKNGAKCSFRPSVLSANARHHAASLWSGWDAHGMRRIFHVCLPERVSRTYKSKFERVKALRDWLGVLSIREKSQGGIDG